MEGDISIVVPMKVWTTGLHGFRAKYLQSPRVMIPPHLPILELSGTDRFSGFETRRLADLLHGFSHDLSAFPYHLSRLIWEGKNQSLSLGPRVSDSFVAIRNRIQKELSAEKNYREKYEPRLLLAANSGKSQYELEEAFRLMNGDAFSISCRATEMEIYRKQSGDWLLGEVIPLQESEEN